jgi:hypothetical protein
MFVISVSMSKKAKTNYRFDRVPDNEFTEFCTADFPSDETMYREWLLMQEKRERREWLKTFLSRLLASILGSLIGGSCAIIFLRAIGILC